MVIVSFEQAGGMVPRMSPMAMVRGFMVSQARMIITIS